MARAIVIHVDEPTYREVVKVSRETDTALREMGSTIEKTETALKEHVATCEKGAGCPAHSMTAKEYLKQTRGWDFDGLAVFNRVLHQVERQYLAAGPLAERQPVTTDY